MLPARSLLVYIGGESGQPGAQAGHFVPWADLLRDLLQIVSEGPQWIRSVALRLDTAEDVLHEYFGDLLARGWLEPVVIDDDELTPFQRSERDRLLDTTARTPKEADITELRFEWTRFLSTLPALPVFSFALTPAGHGALQSLDVVAHP